MKSITIYCDVDGVLADLGKAISQIINRPTGPTYIATELLIEALNKIIAKETNQPISKVDIDQYPELVSQFWANLDWISGGRILWRNLKLLNMSLRILTSCPEKTETTQFKGTVAGKKEWCQQLGISSDQILICPYRTKGTYVKAPTDILIDDNHHNIVDWVANGGIGIHHSHKDLYKTLNQLIEIL